MLEENIAWLSNCFWKKSLDNINAVLSKEQIKSFNMNDYYYLTVIYQLENPTFSDVARELKLTKPSITAMVKRLTKNELIYKTQSETDRRIFHLKLTEKGQKIIQGDYSLYSGLAQILADVLSEEQVTEISGILQKLIKDITEEKPKQED